MRISDWSSDVCSSDLRPDAHRGAGEFPAAERAAAAVLGLRRPCRGRPAGRDRFLQDRPRADAAASVLVDGARRNRADRGDRAHLRRMAQQQGQARSEEHTSELQSLMRISYAVLRLKKKKTAA